MTDIKFTALHGKGVLTQDGREVGEVDDIVINHEGWNVPTLVLKLSRDLLEEFNMKKPMFGTQTINLPTAFVSGVGDKVILTKKLVELTPIAKAQDDGDAADGDAAVPQAPAEEAAEEKPE